MKPLKLVAESRIGLQTFAKAFFIMSRPEAAQRQIESEYLLPLIFSPKHVRSPVVIDLDEIKHVVFACDREETELDGTGAKAYIEQAMRIPVAVRGKGRVVEGFHQAPRLARAGRTPWYNLKTGIVKRGAYPILIPRRVFESYLVVHNWSAAIANEDFIELRPLRGQTAVAPLLAFLNSSAGEFLVRSSCFQYGGGVFNLNPGAARQIPVLDPASLPPPTQARLVNAWANFVAAFPRPQARAELDEEIGQALGQSRELRHRIDDGLDLLNRLSGGANRAHARSEPRDTILQ